MGAICYFLNFQSSVFVCKCQQKHLHIYTRHTTVWSSSRPTYCYHFERLWAGVNQRTYVTSSHKMHLLCGLYAVLCWNHSFWKVIHKETLLPCVNLNFHDKQGNEPENPLFYFH